MNINSTPISAPQEANQQKTTKANDSQGFFAEELKTLKNDFEKQPETVEQENPKVAENTKEEISVEQINEPFIKKEISECEQPKEVDNIGQPVAELDETIQIISRSYKPDFQNIITEDVEIADSVEQSVVVESKPFIQPLEEPVVYKVEEQADIIQPEKKEEIFKQEDVNKFEEPIEIQEQNISKKDITSPEVVPTDLVEQDLTSQEDIPQETFKQNLVQQEIVTQNIVREDIVEQSSVQPEVFPKDIFVEGNFEEQIKVSEPEKIIQEPAQNSINSENIVNESVNRAISVLHELVREFNQSDDKKVDTVKSALKPADKKAEKETREETLINNDFNIQENKEILPQMNPNMNFGGDGQPFSSFMNNTEQSNNKNGGLTASAKDLAEEAEILSTMAENIAMANKANIEEPVEKVVTKNDGIKKVNTKTGITQETIVKFDTVIMNEADVEVFSNLVQNGEVNMNNLAPEAAEKAVNVSKTLVDMLAKAMEDNKPIRIDFDNDISVIIKISRDGKIRADFLPSSQVAETYLKENLPLLKQRFDEQNIDYDELNRRERREQDKEQSRKKGRDNE